MRTLILLAAVLLVAAFPPALQAQKGKNEKEKTRQHGMRASDEEEEEEDLFPLRRFEYGINIGAYFPNNYSANFYNGTPGNVNNVDYILNNQYWLRDIKQLLGVSENDIIRVISYPTDMNYNISMMGGVFLRVNVDRKNGIFLQANYARLQAGGGVTLELPYPVGSQNQYRLEKVIGREGRVIIDLGYQRAFPTRSRISWLVQGSFTLCYTQVLKSVFIVEGREFNMINLYGNNNYIPGANQQTLNINQNAFGYGGTLGLALGVPITDAFSLEPGAALQYYPTNLENYPNYKPSFSLYLRILLHSGEVEE